MKLLTITNEDGTKSFMLKFDMNEYLTKHKPVEKEYFQIIDGPNYCDFCASDFTKYPYVYVIEPGWAYCEECYNHIMKKKKVEESIEEYVSTIKFGKIVFLNKETKKVLMVKRNNKIFCGICGRLVTVSKKMSDRALCNYHEALLGRMIITDSSPQAFYNAIKKLRKKENTVGNEKTYRETKEG